MDDTKTHLEEVLEETRSESYGITIDLVARIICEKYDAAEVRMLINGLERYRKDV